MRLLLPVVASLAVLSWGCSCSGTSHTPSDTDGATDGSADAPFDASGPTVEAAVPDAPGDGSHSSTEAERFRELCHAVAAIQCEGDRACCDEGRRWFENEADCLEIRGQICDLMADGEAFARGLLTAPADPDAVLADARAAMEACLEHGWMKSWVQGELGEGADCTPRDLLWDLGLGGARPPSDASMLHACRPGLRCEVTGTDEEWIGTCGPRGEEGGSCHLPDDCAVLLHCDVTDHPPGYPSTAGTCVPRRDSGADCDLSHECLSESCIERVCTDAPAPWGCRP